MEDGFVGKRVYSRWTVVGRGKDYIYPSTGKAAIRYNCLCDCGEEGWYKGHLLNCSSQSLWVYQDWSYTRCKMGQGSNWARFGRLVVLSRRAHLRVVKR